MNKNVRLYELWEAIKELQEVDSLELVFKLVVVEDDKIIRDKTLFGEMNFMMIYRRGGSPYIRIAKIDENYDIEFLDAFQADKACKWIICTDFNEVVKKTNERRFKK